MNYEQKPMFSPELWQVHANQEVVLFELGLSNNVVTGRVKTCDEESFLAVDWQYMSMMGSQGVQMQKNQNHRSADSDLNLLRQINAEGDSDTVVTFPGSTIILYIYVCIYEYINDIL